MIQRLLNFYRNATQGSPETLHAIWESIRMSSQAPLLKALEEQNAAALQDALNDTQVLWGIEHQEFFLWNEPRGLEALNRLGRRIGIIAVQNPEQPSPIENWFIKDVPGMKAHIESIVGELWLPPCFGRACERGTGAPYMLLHSLAQCWTLNAFFAEFPTDILEIGAGVGMFGYSAKRFGARRYVVVDLPTTAVAGAYCLATVMGEDSVWLYGEPKNASAYARFYPSTRYADAAGQYDLAFNGNALPEMQPDVQDRYLQFIQVCLPLGNVFYSVNHESDYVGQRNVFTAIRSQPRLKRIYRAPFMMRDGYMEEMYMKV